MHAHSGLSVAARSSPALAQFGLFNKGDDSASTKAKKGKQVKKAVKKSFLPFQKAPEPEPEPESPLEALKSLSGVAFLLSVPGAAATVVALIILVGNGKPPDSTPFEFLNGFYPPAVEKKKAIKAKNAAIEAQKKAEKAAADKKAAEAKAAEEAAAKAAAEKAAKKKAAEEEAAKKGGKPAKAPAAAAAPAAAPAAPAPAPPPPPAPAPAPPPPAPKPAAKPAAKTADAAPAAKPKNGGKPKPGEARTVPRATGKYYKQFEKISKPEFRTGKPSPVQVPRPQLAHPASRQALVHSLRTVISVPSAIADAVLPC